MITKPKLQVKGVAEILGGISRKTVLGLTKKSTQGKPNISYDPTFPKLERIGRSIYIDSNEFYYWLSQKADFNVTTHDRAITSKHVQAMLGRSHTWIWQNTKGEDSPLPKPFKVGRLNFWMLSQFEELPEKAA